MKKLNILLSILCLLAVTSCDNFLDVKPSNSSDSSTSIQTAADARVMMNGIMRKMTSSSYYGRNFFLYGDTKGGDLAITSQGKGSDALYVFNHSASSGSYSGFWSQMYNTIAQINNMLANIEELESVEGAEDFTQLKGEALTARAHIYFDLVRLYGKPYNMDKAALGVPNITALLDAADQPGRATVAENYAQIMADLKAGEALLAEDKSGNDGYFSYYANMADQAKVNLYMEDYPAALAAAKVVIESDEYELYENDDWSDAWTSEYGSESILELGICLDEADLGKSSLGFYLMRKDKEDGAMGCFLASDYFLSSLAEDATDVRWGIMDYDEISDTRFGCCNKYSLGDKEGSITAVNIKVIRLSEIYLIAAEAALSSDKQLAADYLNEIRKRSPGLAPATAATVTLDMILAERGKELFAEGSKFFDMMRCNKSITFNDELITPAVIIKHREKTIDRTFYKTILPIDKGEMDANPVIAKQQNPGY